MRARRRRVDWNLYGFMFYEQRMNYLLTTLMYCLVLYCSKKSPEVDCDSNEEYRGARTLQLGEQIEINHCGVSSTIPP